jgi:two-component system CheB/CheR fusion protein
MTNVPLSIVGIGASAGGIDAFHRFFEKMPPDSGLGFVVVLHLAANSKSMLPEILARWTAMPVAEAKDGDMVVANRVLVIPPGNVVTLTDGRLSLRKSPTDAPREHAPIDALFDSMATSLGEDAVGVVLSGTGHDGALGLKAIKARGGLTLAQGRSGTEPEYSGMPDSAAAIGAVDLLVPVEQMPAEILEAYKARQTTLRKGDQPVPDFVQVQQALCEILLSRLGHDFSQYKQQTFMRRVHRRMQALRLSSYDAYLACLRTDHEQAVALFRDLLTGVTSFFRDAAVFAALETDIIPRLFKGKDASSSVRVWVPGCATGEEAYSLAILLREYMDTLSVLPTVQIFASDIDEVAISTARVGRYPAMLLEGVSDERRSRFFEETTGGYVVGPAIRELCTFSVHNLIRDPPFSRIDLLSCRNLLIYMDSALQDRVIPIFHYTLVPGGFLVLGISESVTRHDRLFHPLDRLNHIFVRLEGLSDASRIYALAGRIPRSGAGVAVTARSDPRADWPKAVAIANRRVLERFAAPFVVVNRDGQVAHFSNHTGRFLQPAPGSPSANLFELARPGWAMELRTGLQRCIETGRPFEQVRPILGAAGAATTTVRLVVEPLPRSEGDPLYLIVFDEMDSPKPHVTSAENPAVPEDTVAVARLERENRDLREQLQSIVEEHAVSVEELRSSNEELQSVNEELQSANEELETSREEIQSINEELHTVNAQLSNKVEQLDRSNGDLKNLFESTKVATVFLDPFLIIRSFTPEIANIYNLIPSDIGRPLTDIVSRPTYATLRDDVQTVLRTLQPMEKRVERIDGSTNYLMRILPYRSPDSTIDGSLITFVDVTSIVRAEQHQRLLVDELNHRVKNMLTVVISLAQNSLRVAPTLSAFQEVFLGRIHALTDAYSLLGREGWSKVQLRDLLMVTLKPFLSNESVNVVLTGPPVLLEPRVALALGMTVHELTTNAAKYGALSVPDGTVDIRWAVENSDDTDCLVLKWVERNGPPVTPPDHRGFGMTLIERGFAYDVGGDAKVDFAPEGVTATLRAPLGSTTPKEIS